MLAGDGIDSGRGGRAAPVLTRTNSGADADSAGTGACASAVATPADPSSAPLARTGSHASTDSTDAMLLETEDAWRAAGAPGAPAGSGTPPRTATRSQGRLDDPAAPWCTPRPPLLVSTLHTLSNI